MNKQIQGRGKLNTIKIDSMTLKGKLVAKDEFYDMKMKELKKLKRKISRFNDMQFEI